MVFDKKAYNRKYNKEYRRKIKEDERRRKVVEAMETGRSIRWMCECCGSYTLANLRYLDQEKRVLCKFCLKLDEAGREEVRAGREKTAEILAETKQRRKDYLAKVKKDLLDRALNTAKKDENKKT